MQRQITDTSLTQVVTELSFLSRKNNKFLYSDVSIYTTPRTHRNGYEKLNQSSSLHKGDEETKNKARYKQQSKGERERETDRDRQTDRQTDRDGDREREFPVAFYPRQRSRQPRARPGKAVL